MEKEYRDEKEGQKEGKMKYKEDLFLPSKGIDV